MGTAQLQGKKFIELVTGGAANLQANVSIVNDLNVFPIPDGDTGDNMSLTMAGGIQAIEGCSEGSLSEISEKLAQGMLLCARGNSGVILSQLFAGLAKGFHGLDAANIKTVGFAIRSGVRRAYESVMKPTEGTMLTVAREAADQACADITPESTLESFLGEYLTEMNASLQRTPELLSVLKEAGVIDSGGAGLVYLIDGMNRSLHGRTEKTDNITTKQKSTDTRGFNENSVMKFGYCTEFLLQLQTCKVNLSSFSIKTITNYLDTVGDSVVAFQTGSIVKVHVHTMTPGSVLGFCQKYGEFLSVKIDNMAIQHNDSIVQNRFEISDGVPPQKQKQFGVVTVASGAGVQEAFRNLGADVVIDGRDGKNPSTEDFMKAFDVVNAETVFVLPNNSDIIMAARQAAELYTKSDIRVLESRNIGDGYAALSMLSFDSGNVNEITDTLNQAMNGVVTGLVTTSTRDATLNGVTIHEHDYIGFSEKNMIASSPSKTDTARILLEKLGISQKQVLIVIYGIDVTEEEKRMVRRYMTEHHSKVELFEIDGGQDIYSFMLILE